jgi:hypothetical protein
MSNICGSLCGGNASEAKARKQTENIVNELKKIKAIDLGPGLEALDKSLQDLKGGNTNRHRAEATGLISTFFRETVMPTIN